MDFMDFMDFMSVCLFAPQCHLASSKLSFAISLCCGHRFQDLFFVFADLVNFMSFTDFMGMPLFTALPP